MRRHLLATLFSALVLAAPYADAGAQMGPGAGRGMMHDQCEPGMGMMCMMGENPRMTMRDDAMARHVEQRLANLKERLKIADAQTGPWDAYAGAVREAAKAMAEQRMSMREKARTATLPQRIELHEALLVSHLEHLRKTKAAAAALYAVLGDEQKKTADTAMMGPMMHRRGPMRGRHMQ